MPKVETAPSPGTAVESAPCFVLSIEGGIAHLQMSRPQAMNTMNPQFWRELENSVDTLQRTGQARVLILSSTGKHFTAGMALDMFSSGITMDSSTVGGRGNIALMLDDMQRAFTKLAELRMPVIAAIQGGCIGGGVDLICCADIRLATRDSFFCIQEINIGMIADLGTLQRLPKLIPDALVREMAYTGCRLPSSRALTHGLVNETFEDHDALLAAAQAMAQEIASKPPAAIWGSKQAINFARDHGVTDSLKYMGTLQSGFWDPASVTEAIEARKAGRAAEFPDLPALRTFTDFPRA
jgi:enoyl-CoA hydratase